MIAHYQAERLGVPIFNSNKIC